MRIVYVEDNIANVHLVKRVARMGKHEVINYIDGMDAYNNFDTDNPDLVLMDIQLAGELTGIEVVKKLREKGFKAPIYAVTAYAMVGDRERCIEAGCTGYISKPIPIPDLVKLFAQYDEPTQSTISAKPVESKDTAPETKTLLSAKTFIQDNPKDNVTESKKPKSTENAKQDDSVDDLTETKTLLAAANVKQADPKDDKTESKESDTVENPKSESPKESKTENDSVNTVAEFDNDDTISVNKDEPAQMI